jgi:hypothetical protein
MLLGAPYQAGGGASAGAVYLVLGPVSGIQSLSKADAKLVGEAEGDYAGNPVSSGDIDGDGVAEILVGAFGQDAGGSSAGAVYVVRGTASGLTSLSAAEAKLVGAQADDGAGWSIATGDVDGEGVEALVVGAAGADTGGPAAGAVYVVRGPVAGTMQLAKADATIVGENDGDNAGYSLVTGDVGGDGYTDLLIGATSEDTGGSGAGAVYLIPGEGY